MIATPWRLNRAVAANISWIKVFWDMDVMESFVVSDVSARFAAAV
jgi:hypothetical protein